MVIGFCGKAGSGKTFAGEHVSNLLGKKSIQVALADPLKIICQSVFGFTNEQLYGPSEARSQEHPNYPGVTARRALQTLGTEWGRALAPDIWVNLVLQRCASLSQFYDHFVVTDVRFKNEVDAIVNNGGIVIKLVRDGVSEPVSLVQRIIGSFRNRWQSHQSETEIDGIDDSSFSLVMHVPEGVGNFRALLTQWAFNAGLMDTVGMPAIDHTKQLELSP